MRLHKVSRAGIVNEVKYYHFTVSQSFFVRVYRREHSSCSVTAPELMRVRI